MSDQTTLAQQARVLEASWATDPRWRGIERAYTADDVVRLRGTIQIEHTLAKLGAERLWKLLHEEPEFARPGEDRDAKADRDMERAIAAYRDDLAAREEEERARGE